MAEETDPLPGSTVGGYEIKRRLGRGGMGVVYLAEHTALARPVALKVLLPEHSADESYRERFLLEARTAARIEHTNVVTVYDARMEPPPKSRIPWFGGRTDAPLLYFVMQFVDGGDLDGYARARVVDHKEAASIGVSIARGLAAAWAEGVVHLDIKPGNVLRFRDQWKVADFGLARRVVDVEKDKGEPQIGGTPCFMPPEQWAAESVDGRTDLYALGVTLYWLLARGKFPFDVQPGWKLRDFLKAHMGVKPRPIRDHVPDLPEPFAQLVMQLLEKDQEDRPPSAVVVADELGEIAASRKRPTTGAPGVLPAPEAGPYVGREDELEGFERALEAAHQGKGAVLAFTGPRGIGKTSLLEELARRARGEGALVVLATARAQEPLACLRQVLGRVLGADDQGTRAGPTGDGVRERLRESVARFSGSEGIKASLPALEVLLLGAEAPAFPPLRLTVPALAGFVKERAASIPVVVLVDDLQRADSVTRDFVTALGAETAVAPIVLAVTAPDASVLGALGATLQRFALEPLSAIEIVAVASEVFATLPERPRVPSKLLAALAEPAQGIPAVLVAAARAALESGTVKISDSAVLEGDTRAVRALVEKLRAELSGPEAPPAATASTDEAFVPRLVALGVARRILGDYRGAIATLEEARASLGSARSPDAQILAVLRELAQALVAAGERLDEAASAARGAGEIAGRLSLARERVEARLIEVTALYLLRRYEDALRALDADLGEPVASLDAALLHRRGLVLSRMKGKEHEALVALEQCLKRASEEGDQDLYASAAQSLGDMLLRAGELDRAERSLQVSRSYKQRLGDTHGLALVHGSLGRIAHRRGDRPGAISHYAADLAIARKLGDLRGIGVAANSLGEQHELLYIEKKQPADVEAAERAYEQAREAAAASKNEVDQAISAFYLGRFYRRCKKETHGAEGTGLLEKALASFRALGKSDEAATVETALAETR